MNKQGYIYILTNISIPGKVKIGRTERYPEDRRKEISAATGVPTPFELVYYSYFEDCHFAEKKIHERLFQEGKRTTKSKEFFDIESDIAINVVKKISQELNSNTNNNTKELISDGIQWLYGNEKVLKNEKRALEYFERAALSGSAVGSYFSGICCETISNKIRKKEDKKHWQQRAINHYRDSMAKKYLKAFARASWIYRKSEQKNEANNTWDEFLKLANKSNLEKDTAKWINKWIGQQIEWGNKKNISKHINIKKHKDILLSNLDNKNDPKGKVKSYLKEGKSFYWMMLFILIILLIINYKIHFFDFSIFFNKIK